MDTMWKRYADRMGVEIVSIRKAGWFQRFVSINHWIVVAKYKNRTFKLTAWGGRHNPDLDTIYYSVTDQIENMLKLERFNVDIKKFVPKQEGVSQ